MVIVVVFRLQIYVLIVVFSGEGEVLCYFLNQMQVEGGLLIVVVIDIMIFIVLCQYGWGNKLVIVQWCGVIVGEVSGIGFWVQCVVGVDVFNFGVQFVVVQQGCFVGFVVQVIEVFIVQVQQGMNFGVSGIVFYQIVVCVLVVVIIFCLYFVDYYLYWVGKVIYVDDIVLYVVVVVGDIVKVVVV